MRAPTKQTHGIVGISHIRRLPRLGKIRLGEQVPNASGQGTHPVNLPHFRVPLEVEKVHGKNPTELLVMFATADDAKNANQALEFWQGGGLRCRGNGDTALRRVANLTVVDKKTGEVLDEAKPLDGKLPDDENALVEVSCAQTRCQLHELGICKSMTHLMVLLPKVSMGGVYQIDTASFHNMVRINSGIDYVRGMIGRIEMVPLRLFRQEQEVGPEGKRRKQWLLQLELPVTLPQILELQKHNERTLLLATGLELPSTPAIPAETPREIPEADVVEEAAAPAEEAKPPEKPAEAETPKAPAPEPAKAEKPRQAPPPAASAPAKPAPETAPKGSLRGDLIDDVRAAAMLAGLRQEQEVHIEPKVATYAGTDAGLVNPATLNEEQLGKLLYAFKAIAERKANQGRTTKRRGRR